MPKFKVLLVKKSYGEVIVDAEDADDAGERDYDHLLDSRTIWDYSEVEVDAVMEAQ